MMHPLAIIHMAQAAGLDCETDSVGEVTVAVGHNIFLPAPALKHTFTARSVESLQRFAELAAAAEREACADLVLHLRQSICEVSLEACAMKDALGQAEDAIRASGEKGGAL